MHPRRWLLALVAIALVSPLPVEGYRYLRIYDDLRASQSELALSLDALTERGLSASPDELVRLEARLATTQARLHRASAAMEGDPLLRLASHVPWWGRQTRAAIALAHLGADAAAVGREAAAALAETAALQGDGSLSERLPALLAAVDPHATRMEEALTRMEARRQELSGEGLLPPLGHALAELDRRLPEVRSLLADYRTARPHLPALLGYQGQQRYLVLGMDSTEALPAGGFVLVFGLLEVEGGRPREVFFAPSDSIYLPWKQAGGYVEPPRPLKDYLLRDWPMGLGAVAWWPDFPTAARNAVQLYRLQSGDERPLDGVLGVNFQTLERLLAALGPVRVDRYDVTVDAGNVVPVTLLLTHPEAPRPWETHRYDFVAWLARAIIGRLMQTGPSRWGDLLRALRQLRDEKALLAYSDHPHIQEALVRLGLAGEVRHQDGDYLMVADASVRSTKLNLALRSRLDLTVRLDGQGNALHTLRLTYVNDFPAWAAAQDSRLASVVLAGGSLRMYGSYLRLLVPPGVQAVQVWSDEGPLALEDRWEEHGKAHLGLYLLLPLGARKEVTFSYLVPDAVAERGDIRSYRLLVQRQPGTGATPLRLRVEPPPGAREGRATLDGQPLPGDLSPIETDLRKDRELSLVYRWAGEGRGGP
ncbi:hypothetical protein HRbin25_00014 [bacterium HR25]|nr:hypothetical protein HRbin25_00014 [bacterium HR25]